LEGVCWILAASAIAVRNRNCAFFGLERLSLFLRRRKSCANLWNARSRSYHAGMGLLRPFWRRSFCLGIGILNYAPALWSAAAGFFFSGNRSPPAQILQHIVVVLRRRAKISLSTRFFAWFTIAILLLSSNTAPYTFILLLLPGGFCCCKPAD